MGYRLRYQYWLDWVGPGQSAMGGGQVPIAGSESGGAQTLSGFNATGGQNATGTGTGGAIATSEITTITNAMAADVSAQLNVAAVLARIQAFSSGGA